MTRNGVGCICCFLATWTFVGCAEHASVRIGGDSSAIGATVVADGVVVDTVAQWGRAAVGDAPLEPMGESRFSLEFGKHRLTFIGSMGDTLSCDIILPRDDNVWLSFENREAIVRPD